MFNINIQYKSATPMKLIVAQKPGSKKLFYCMHFSTSLEMLTSPLRLRSGCEKNYCILRPVLWMQ